MIIIRQKDNRPINIYKTNRKFSSYNIFTIASLIASSDLLGLMPTRFYDLFSRCWPLERLPYAPVNSEQVEFSLHYNKLSLRDPVLENVIDIIREAF